MTEPKHANPLYPAIEPYNVGSLPVSDLHTIVYEEVGNPAGRPALSCTAVQASESRRTTGGFDPDYYRIILVDQRGAGRSMPHSEIRENRPGTSSEAWRSCENNLALTTGL